MKNQKVKLMLSKFQKLAINVNSHESVADLFSKNEAITIVGGNKEATKPCAGCDNLGNGGCHGLA